LMAATVITPFFVSWVYGIIYNRQTACQKDSA
jgi:hypothetical protein